MTADISHRTGALLRVSENHVGNYSVTLLREKASLPKCVGLLGKDRYSFQGLSGPFSVAGYFDALRLEIGARITVFEIDLGIFYGAMDDGLRVDFDLGFASGEVQLRVQGDSELWMHPRLEVREPSSPSSLPAFDGPEVNVEQAVEPVRLTRYHKTR